MTTLRQVAEQALLQLEINQRNFEKGPSKSISKLLARGNDDVIETLRKALAEQEPFAWMFEDDYQRMKTSETCCEVYSVKVGSPGIGTSEIKLYTTPPQRQWVGLTDDEVEAAMSSCGEVASLLDISRAIEAKLREKTHDRT